MKKIMLIATIAALSILTAGCFLGKPKIAVMNDDASGTPTSGEYGSYKLSIEGEEVNVGTLAGGSMSDWVKVKQKKDDPITMIRTRIKTNSSSKEASTNYHFFNLKKGTKYVTDIEGEEIRPYNYQP